MEEIEIPVEKIQEDIHHVLHQGHNGGFDKFVGRGALLSAVLAGLAAVCALFAGHYSNEAMILQIQASDQWSYYQAKGTKQNLAELAEGLATDPEKKARFAAEVARYKGEKDEIKKAAEAFEKQSLAADAESAHKLNPHDKLAFAMTLIQIAISLASICVLTRQRWMLALAGVAATGGLVFWVLAFTMTGV